MRIAVLGAGGIGGYFGGLLARHGHTVELLARGAHLEAIRARGLEVRTPEERFVVRLGAVSEPEALTEADLALVTVKSYALGEVAPAARRLAERGAVILPLLNGVGINDLLIEAGVPAAALLGGIAFISAARPEPGLVERYSPFQRIVLGEFGKPTSARAEEIVRVLRAAGVDARVSEQIEVELWQKLIFISSMAAACGLARTSIGPLRQGAHGLALIERAVREAANVARKSGVSLPADAETRVLGFIHGLPPEMRPSFLLDLERGGPTEIDVLSGAISQLGTRHGVDTPIHDAITSVAAAVEEGRQPTA